MYEEKKHKCFKIFSNFLEEVPVTQNAAVGKNTSPSPLSRSNFTLFSYILKIFQAPLPH
jgi:hypothetical protein